MWVEKLIAEDALISVSLASTQSKKTKVKSAKIFLQTENKEDFPLRLFFSASFSFFFFLFSPFVFLQLFSPISMPDQNFAFPSATS